LRERQEFLAKGARASFDQPSSFSSTSTVPSTTTGTTAATTDHQQQQQQPPTLLLGIGTGGIDDFSSSEQPPAADIVSDSPTVVDFNVYDRAFEAEVERIKRSTSRRGAAGGRGRGAAAGAGTAAGAGAAGTSTGPGPIYQTRFRERGPAPVVADENLRIRDPWAFAAAVAGQKREMRRGGMGFAELVKKAMEGAKEGKGSGVASRGGEGEDGSRGEVKGVGE
jgi:[calcium/calmodulin-dependent protein kinase] kinase